MDVRVCGPHRRSASASVSVVSSWKCSYRPAVILPGLGNNSGDYQRLKETLKDKYGVESVVAKVSRPDWLRNAAGLVDPNYWRGTLKPRPVLDWYLERVHDAVQEAKAMVNANAEATNVSLIGHSAGGWLARVYMQEFGVSHISLLLTLGTPHLPPPKGVIDQTRGLLNYVQQNCPKPVYTPQLKYVCIAGRYIKGAPLLANSNSEPHIEVEAQSQSQSQSQSQDESLLSSDTSSQLVSDPIINPSPPNTITLRARFVGQGYKQVCGQADVWGDGVVPQVSAHLEGALNITFDGVYHSPVAADDETRPWYGSPHVLDQWVQHLLN